MPSRSQILQARLAAALVLGLIVLGAVWYGAAVAARRDGVEALGSGAAHIFGLRS